MATSDNELFQLNVCARPSTPPASSPAVFLSSPPRQSSREPTSKPKKAPTVTPRSFRRFFTPRRSLEQLRRSTASRHALGNLDAAATNRKYRSGIRRPSHKDTVTFPDIENESPGGDMGVMDIPRVLKRNFLYSPETTPETQSPVKRQKPSAVEILYQEDDMGSSEEDIEDVRLQLQSFPKPIVRSKMRNGLGRVLRRELDISLDSTRRSMSDYHGMDCQSFTDSFYSGAADSHHFSAQNRFTQIPFSIASCNTNSLVAVGYEGGCVQVLESGKSEEPQFQNAYLSFQPHQNAILDLAFSSDDLLLATASGDQTAKIVDMPTQRVIYTLSGHLASVKHVRFQPGSSNKVIATSSRDGCVHMWDLRCKGIEYAVAQIEPTFDPTEIQQVPKPTVAEKMTWAKCVNIIDNAHAGQAVLGSGRMRMSTTKRDVHSKLDAGCNRNDISITGISFLSPSLPHLLLTGSARNASVKLWDLRTTRNHRVRGQPTPLSTTRQPESHDRHRQFGLTSMALSTDGGRLYTLCRDHTIYAYSTSHLILGTGPELDASQGIPRQRGRAVLESQGLGPLYGLRHPRLHATSFYVKLSVRPAAGDRPELLAAGSSDHCPVLFPTDEKYMRSLTPLREEIIMPSTPTAPRISTQPSITRTVSGRTILGTQPDDMIPIYRHGTALWRGHEKEVTCVSWTNRGELVTIGDDFKTRMWREDGMEASSLRRNAAKGGINPGTGWADCDENWDEVDG